MNNAEDGRATVISDTGVTVYQTFAESEEKFGLPAIAIHIESDREEPVRVQLEQTVPGEIEIDEIGFHEKYLRECWSIEDNVLVFESTVDPDGEVTTMFAIKQLSTDLATTLLDDLALTAIEPVAGAESPTEGDTEQISAAEVVSEDDAGQSEATGSETGSETETAATGQAPPETGGGIYPSGPTHQPATDTGATSEPTTEDTDPLAAVSESASAATAETAEETSADALDEMIETESETTDGSADALDEIVDPETATDDAATTSGPAPATDAEESDSTEPDDQAPDATEPDDEKPDSTEPDDQAPDATEPDDESSEGTETDDEPSEGTESAGETPDSTETDEQFLAELERRLEADELPTEIEQRLRSQLTEPAAATLPRIQQRVEHLQQRVSDVESFSESVAVVHDEYGSPVETFDHLEAEIESLAEEVEQLRDGIVSDDIEPRIDAVQSDVETVDSTVSSVAEQLETVEESVDAVEESIDTVEENVATVEDTQTDLESRVEELEEWRETLIDNLAG